MYVTNRTTYVGYGDTDRESSCHGGSVDDEVVESGRGVGTGVRGRLSSEGRGRGRFRRASRTLEVEGKWLVVERGKDKGRRYWVEPLGKVVGTLSPKTNGDGRTYLKRDK